MASALEVLTAAISGGPDMSNGTVADAHAAALHHATESHFSLEYKTLMFIVALWSSGKIFARLGMPALLGEIVVGIVLGPEVADLAPMPESLELYGELGLMLLMIEAGLHVDMEMLQIVGLRAMLVGLLGSLLPMAMCYPIAMFALGCDKLEAFAVSATMATMSTGIALNIMKAGGVLNQPTGQLIIAAATVNEMVNISLITELGAIIGHGSWTTYVTPLVLMMALVAVIGVMAMKLIPCLLDKVLLPRVRRSQREFLVLGLMFAVALGLMPLCKKTGSSDLLGAFLAGFCFCTDQHVHHTWNRQVKRVAAFLMRLFFACSIGFSIPVRDFADGRVWRQAGILFTCIITKVGMGFLAKPLDLRQFCTLGFAWGAWGEFSFILAMQANKSGLMSKLMYDSVVLAVLLSVVLSPMALRRTLSWVATGAEEEIAIARKATGAEEIGKVHNVYYCLQTRSKACWGQQEQLLSAIFDSGCKIIDFRTFHPIHHIGTHHVENELYLKDTELMLELHEELNSEDQARLDLRIEGLIDVVESSLSGSEPKIKVSRWLPGEGTRELIFSQERGGLSPGSTSRISLDRIVSKDAFHHLSEAAKRHHTVMQHALENDTSHPHSPRAHHELDGFVTRSASLGISGQPLQQQQLSLSSEGDEEEDLSASQDQAGKARLVVLDEDSDMDSDSEKSEESISGGDAETSRDPLQQV